MPLPSPEDQLSYDTYYDKPGRFGPHNQHHPRSEDCRLITPEFLFMTYFNAGLRVFDISNPVAPREAGYWFRRPPHDLGVRPEHDEGSHLEDVAVDSRGYIYCTNPTRGLVILKSDHFYLARG